MQAAQNNKDQQWNWVGENDSTRLSVHLWDAYLCLLFTLPRTTIPPTYLHFHRTLCYLPPTTSTDPTKGHVNRLFKSASRRMHLPNSWRRWGSRMWAVSRCVLLRLEYIPGLQDTDPSSPHSSGSWTSCEADLRDSTEPNTPPITKLTNLLATFIC